MNDYTFTGRQDISIFNELAYRRLLQSTTSVQQREQWRSHIPNDLYTYINSLLHPTTIYHHTTPHPTRSQPQTTSNSQNTTSNSSSSRDTSTFTVHPCDIHTSSQIH